MGVRFTAVCERLYRPAAPGIRCSRESDVHEREKLTVRSGSDDQSGRAANDKAADRPPRSPPHRPCEDAGRRASGLGLERGVAPFGVTPERVCWVVRVPGCASLIALLAVGCAKSRRGLRNRAAPAGIRLARSHDQAPRFDELGRGQWWTLVHMRYLDRQVAEYGTPDTEGGNLPHPAVAPHAARDRNRENP